MDDWNTLFSPFYIGSLRLSNRVVMAAMGTNFGAEDGTVTDRTVQYYSERAKGGAGLIITESSPVNEAGRHRRRCIGAFDDRFLPGLRSLTDEVHSNGASIALQLNHAGRCIGRDLGRNSLLAPSPIPRIQGDPPPREMSRDEIEQTVADFGRMACRAKKAGFDAVEIHGAHGYLIHQFLSPRSNRREDEYGGSRENRGRFAVEITRRVRAEVGDSFPIIFRLGARELVEGGYELEEGLSWARQIESAGADALNISGGTGDSPLTVVQFISPMSFPEGCFVSLSEAVKGAVQIPVIVANRLNTPALAEQVLKEGKADFIAVGRNFLTDPDWPMKAKRGETERIRPCVACNVCIWSLQQANGDVTCFQNAALGREAESRIQPVKPKKVLVIGGGPGGMEAARVAGKRGHQVILYETKAELGGQFQLASVPPHKGPLKKAVSWLIRELDREGVEIRLREEVTRETLEREKPDGVIVAVGASPVVPGVFTGPSVITAWDVLAGKETGKAVLVVGGGLVGAETAEFLCAKGCRVTIVEMLDDLAKDMEGTTRALLLERLSAMKVSVLLSTKVKEIRNNKILACRCGEDVQLNADTVVLALGARANPVSCVQGTEETCEVILIGDCVEARKAKEAIHEGFLAGLRICS